MLGSLLRTCAVPGTQPVAVGGLGSLAAKPRRYELTMVKTTILNSSLKNRSIIRLHYQAETEEEYDGIVVQATKRVVVLACEKDFESDGYQVLLRNRIKGYRNSKFEKCCTQIMEQNSQLEKIRPPKWVYDIEDIESVVKKMKKHGIWPAIETIYNSESAFYIGPITSLSPELFKLYCYDAAGKWEKEYEFGFDDVIRIEWASKYCKHFNKFMKMAHNPFLHRTPNSRRL